MTGAQTISANVSQIQRNGPFWSRINISIIHHGEAGELSDRPTGDGE